MKADETQKESPSTVVRIWRAPKKRLERVRDAREEKEGRPVTEAELVSKAVNMLCKIEERKLGIKTTAE